ncbi:lectin [Hypoxylon fragiforme]|uniref:lectin n=1 Tax=Hypoxylon fragiforme TaxID=63214 RepID=UPI0020C6ACBD|nr:lectin [Hypoxylon fragiforme]KAI2612205.1 lectin [Hypoxylon fragiforme]
MSYSIKVRVYQTNTNAFFTLVESGCWHYASGGTWDCSSPPCSSSLTLSMGGSGTSGMLRFRTEQGKEAFFVAMGVHNYKPWVDVVTGLANDVTCVSALPEYYNDVNPVRCKAREAQRTSQTILNADHRKISANYCVTEGKELQLNIVIG